MPHLNNRPILPIFFNKNYKHSKNYKIVHKYAPCFLYYKSVIVGTDTKYNNTIENTRVKMPGVKDTTIGNQLFNFRVRFRPNISKLNTLIEHEQIFPSKCLYSYNLDTKILVNFDHFIMPILFV